MTIEEQVEMSSKIVREFHDVFNANMKGTAEQDQRQVASLCLGKMLGAAYSTDLERNGPENARRFISQLLMLATSCAQMSGADPDFNFAIIEKK